MRGRLAEPDRAGVVAADAIRAFGRQRGWVRQKSQLADIKAGASASLHVGDEIDHAQ
jgi:hypothetical protein